jgi:hypothetical protein
MDALELVATIAAFAGLAAVVGEIWLKDRTVFTAIATDARAFAEPSGKVTPRSPSVTPKIPVYAGDAGIMQAA